MSSALLLMAHHSGAKLQYDAEKSISWQIANGAGKEQQIFKKFEKSLHEHFSI
jgi:hypothetical protein